MFLGPGWSLLVSSLSDGLKDSQNTFVVWFICYWSHKISVSSVASNNSKMEEIAI